MMRTAGLLLLLLLLWIIQPEFGFARAATDSKPSEPITGGVERKSGREVPDVGEKTTEKIPRPETCEAIRAGAAGTITEQAAEADCESSQHLGAGTGVSSGTGSGKMGPGGGPR